MSAERSGVAHKAAGGKPTRGGPTSPAAAASGRPPHTMYGFNRMEPSDTSTASSSLLSASIDVIVTPPLAMPCDKATSARGADTKPAKKSRLNVIRQSFRSFRSGWTKKKSQLTRRRSKSLGAEASRENSRSTDGSDSPLTPFVRCKSKYRREKERLEPSEAELEDVFEPLEPVEVVAPISDKRSGKFLASAKNSLDSLRAQRRKRSKSYENEAYRLEVDESRRVVLRKRSSSLSSTISKSDRQDLIDGAHKLSCAVSTLQSPSPEHSSGATSNKSGEHPVLLLTPVEAFGESSRYTRRRSRSVNDISLVEEDFFQARQRKTSVRQASLKQKPSGFFRSLSVRFSRRKRIKKIDVPDPSPHTSGEFSPKRHWTDKMGQNLSASGTASPSPTDKEAKYELHVTTDAHAGSKKSKDDREELSRLREELMHTRKQLFEKEQQLFKQHREIHKLKSVLEQQRQAHAAQGGAAAPDSTVAALLPQKSISHSAAPTKKCGVSGESLTAVTAAFGKIDKDFRSRQLIKEALLDNSFLQNFIDSHQLRLIVDAMFEKEFAKGSLLCEQGTIGSHLFVIAYGHCQIITNKEPVNSIGPGKAFGELAILYNCCRTASVKALTKVRVWVLDRRVFQAVMMKTGKDKRLQYKTFLKSVPLLQNLSDEMIAKIVDSIEVDLFPAGDYICRQGCHGDSFYIISNGSVRVSQEVRKEGSDEIEDKVIRTLNKGDYFGEKALWAPGGTSLRTANVISNDCECLILDRNAFHSLIGDLDELRGKQYENEATMPTPRFAVYEVLADEEGVNDLKLDDLDVVATLGIGGFGRVDLVRSARDESRVYALKSCSKAFIRSTQQEQHIKNERHVQRIASRHQFITRLFRTYKDANFVYFLMEAALGGELWTLLRNKGAFDELTSRFYIACVVEALQFLHSQHIVYRDLKPENCLLDASGYLKLTDFGFSKVLGPGEKTWTFCGTPEYVAPEIVLNRGHDHAVDFWSIGILLYELLTGLPPFQSSDPLKTYNIILRGFDAIGFDEKVFSKHAVNLIRRLCRENPSERIGVQKNGYLDLKRHKWFSGFDWSALVKRALRPPIIPKLSGPTDARYFDISPQDMSMRTDFDQETSDDELSTLVDPDWDANF